MPPKYASYWRAISIPSTTADTEASSVLSSAIAPLAAQAKRPAPAKWTKLRIFIVSNSWGP